MTVGGDVGLAPVVEADVWESFFVSMHLSRTENLDDGTSCIFLIAMKCFSASKRARRRASACSLQRPCSCRLPNVNDTDKATVLAVRNQTTLQ